MNTPIIEANDLRMYFPVGRTLSGKPRRLLKAVDDVSFSIGRGQTVSTGAESLSRQSKRRRQAVNSNLPYFFFLTAAGSSISGIGAYLDITSRKRKYLSVRSPHSLTGASSS